MVNISGGTFDEEFIADGGTINITGGDFGPEFETNSGSVVNISGGVFGEEVSFGSGSEVNLLGSDFRLDGSPVEDILSSASATQISFGPESVLSGFLADGSPFSFEFPGGSDPLSGPFVSLRLSQAPSLPGDVNRDGVVDFGDIPSFISVLQSGVYLDEADVNGDGAVDFDDIPAFIFVLQSQ